jgi:hypothetical protein
MQRAGSDAPREGDGMRTLVQRYYGINIYRVSGERPGGPPDPHEAIVMMRNRRGTFAQVKRRIDAAVASLPKLNRSKWAGARLRDDPKR